jgi:hypothetical protein
MTDSPLSEVISAAIEDAIGPVLAQNEYLQESLDSAMLSLRMEDKGWLSLLGVGSGDHLEGFDLEELKTVSRTMREKTAAGSLYDRGVSIHIGYVWGHGINIPGTEASGKQGAPSALRKFYLNNRDSLFGATARSELQRCRYTDGNIFALCEPGEPVRLIPLREIEDILVNPDFPSEIWAYLRVWTPDTRKPQEQKAVWYYTKRYKGTKLKSITNAAGERILVGKGVIVDKGFNKQVGWVLGIPDVAPAAPWIEAYNICVQAGRTVVETLSTIAFKVISPNKKGAANAAAKMAGMNTRAGTASMAEGSDLQFMSSAVQAYPFDKLRPIAANAAAGIDVQLMELLSDTSASGSSYGSAQALSPSILNAMKFMQDEWIELYTDIFEAYGIPVPDMSFDPITEPDPYRKAQEITLLSVALSDEEYRAAVLDQLNIEGSPTQIPPTLAARSQPAKQAASPDQGRNSAAGATDTGAKNDLRTDTVSEALRMMQLDEMRELVERFEAVANHLGSQSN